MKKLILMLVILPMVNRTFAQSPSSAQSEGFTTSIVTFLNNLDSELNTFFDRQNAERISRDLSYIQIDLRNYLKTRQQFVHYIEGHPNKLDQMSEHHAKVVYQQLSKEISDIRTRFENVETYCDANLDNDAKTIESMTAPAIQGDEVQQGFLDQLNHLLSGQLQTDMPTLVKQGDRIYHQLQQSLDMIDTIQAKLKEKYNI